MSVQKTLAQNSLLYCVVCSAPLNAQSNHVADRIAHVSSDASSDLTATIKGVIIFGVILRKRT
jgi:hypothetical protein